MEIVCAEDCRNAPKKALLRDIHVFVRIRAHSYRYVLAFCRIVCNGNPRAVLQARSIPVLRNAASGRLRAR